MPGDRERDLRLASDSSSILSDDPLMPSAAVRPPPKELPRILSAADPGRYALITLTLINLLNYIDRYVPSATKQYFQADLHLSNTQTSLPLTAFVFVYMICSPIFSALADRGYRRSRLIAAGVVIWSIATAAGALAIDFWTLLISRSLVGVGEAAYATIAPALISDYYPASRRNAVLSFFYLAIPIGSAMGYALGGEVGGYWGWRYAFFISGAPGILVAVMCLAINEPKPGAADEPAEGAGTHGSTVGEDSSSSRPLSRRGSAHDLLASQGMLSSLDDDAGEDSQPGFATSSELGGPALTHPHTHAHPHSSSSRAGGYHPPAQRGGGGGTEASILVRSTDSDSSDAPSPSSAVASDAPPAWIPSLKALLANPTYMYSTVGLTFVIFASGGLADWFPSWMNRAHGVAESTAATTVGGITCVGGILGTAWGSWLGEKCKGRMKQPYLGVAGLNMIVTVLCAWCVFFFAENIYIISALVLIAQIAMWSYTGPITALTINCVPANMRVRAFAFQIFLSHALGDAISPSLIGAMIDGTGSIRTAMLLIPIAFTCGMIVWLVGWRRLADEETFDGHVHSVGAADKSDAKLVARGGGGGGGGTLDSPLMHAQFGADARLESHSDDAMDAIRLKRFSLDAKQQQRQDIM